MKRFLAVLAVWSCAGGLYAADVPSYQSAIQTALPHIQEPAIAGVVARLQTLDFQSPSAVLKPLMTRLEQSQDFNETQFLALPPARQQEQLGIVIQDEAGEAQDSAETLLARYGADGHEKKFQDAKRRRNDLAEAEALLIDRHVFLDESARARLGDVHANLKELVGQGRAEARIEKTAESVTRYLNSPDGAPPVEPRQAESFGDSRAPKIWDARLPVKLNINQVATRLVHGKGAAHPEDISAARAALKKIKDAGGVGPAELKAFAQMEKILGIDSSPTRQAAAPKTGSSAFLETNLGVFVAEASQPELLAAVRELFKSYRSSIDFIRATPYGVGQGIAFVSLDVRASIQMIAVLSKLANHYKVAPPHG